MIPTPLSTWGMRPIKDSIIPRRSSLLHFLNQANVWLILDSASEWYGVRYAQAPIGELRFRAPQDIELKNNYSAAHPIDATRIAPTCIQGIPRWWQIPDPAAPAGSDEDCLLLNILAPASAKPSSNLAVMVQIHGGGALLLA